MNAREINFAYKVRHALTENLDNLPAPAVDKLAAARRIALSRKKKHHPLRALVTRGMLTTGTAVFSGPSSWITRMGMAVPLIALVTGLVGIYQFEQERRINDLAEIDAEVLTDELPLSAYLDHGFNAFLEDHDQ